MEIAIVVVIVFVVYLATITHAEKQKDEEQRSESRQEELERQVTYIEKAEAAKDKDRYMNFDCHFCDFVWEATPNEILEKDKEGSGRYTAFVQLKVGGSQPTMIDLGESEKINMGYLL